MTTLPPQSIGILIRTNDPFDTGLINPAVLAERAEELGFDGLWVGDHLAFKSAWVEARVALASIATATTQPLVGHCVLLTALRHAAWVAKHVSSMHLISAGRFVLGVGVGGENPAEWGGVGVPVSERGRRTDELLEALPHLLAGEARRMKTEDVEIPPLAPVTPMPPVVIGGRAEAALARTVAYGDMWLGAFVDRPRLIRSIERLQELTESAGRQSTPAVGLTVTVAVGPDFESAVAGAASFVERNYDARWEQMERFAIAGELDDVVERICGLRDLGLRHLVLQGTGTDPLRDYEALARVREAVLAQVSSSGSTQDEQRA